MSEQLTQKSRDLCKKFWEWRLKNFPEFATSTSDHRYDDRLSDLSVDGFYRRFTQSRELLTEIESVVTKLNENSLTDASLELLASELRMYINGFKHSPYHYPINQCQGLHISFPKLIKSMPQSQVEDYVNIFARMTSFATQISDIIELMKQGVTKGMTMHICSVGNVTKQLENIVNLPIEESAFYQIFQKKPSPFTSKDWGELTKQAYNIIESSVNPALRRLMNFLTSYYLPNCREKISSETLPNGKEYYKSCLEYHTSTSLSPAEIHTIGIAEVQRIQERIRVLLNEIGYDSTYIELIQNIEQNNMAECSDDTLIDGFTALYEQILNKMPKLFNSLPKRSCDIKTTNSPSLPSGCYIQGDSKHKGVFWISTDKLKGMSFRSTALALHEMIPGHHLQNDVILQKDNMAAFRRFKESGNYNVIPARFPLYTAYMEGWALYAEGIGEDMGIYKNPYELLGRLYCEIFRAARLVVDTGIHAFDWTKEQAILYLQDVVGMNLNLATSEVCRYVTWPGQACSYKIGELKIKELRHHIMEHLGNELFDIKEFHDVILHSGEVPFDIIERNLSLYVEAKLFGEKFDLDKLT